MATYTIKPEFLPMWGEDATEETVITESDVERLANDWGITPDELREQLIPV